MAKQGDDSTRQRREERRIADFGRNLLAVATWEFVWGFGAAFVAGPIVTAMALQLTSSKAVVGVLGLMQAAAVPALLLSAYVNRRLGQRRRFVAGFYALLTSTWLLVALLSLAGGIADPLLLAALVASQAIIYFISGLLTAPTYELLSEAFGRRYGTATGVQLLVNRSTGVVGGLVAQQILAANVFPTNFGWTLLVGGLTLTVSNLAVLAMAEPPAPARPVALPLGTYLTGLRTTVQAHRDYLLFLGVVMLLAFVTVVQGFYTTFALERLGLPPAQAGLFAAVLFAATGVGALTGPLGDRWGHRRLLVAALVLHAAATGVVLTSQWTAASAYYAGLAASGIATAVASIATTNLMVDFAPPGEKGAYAAVGRLATLGAGAALTPLAGGLIDVLGYDPVFWAGVALPIAGLLATRAFGEPRFAAQPR